MIKNVIVVNDYDYVQGGASLVALEQANLLYSAGFNVVFFCGVSNKEKSILNSEIKEIVTNEFDSLNNPSKIGGIFQGINNKNAYKKMNELLSSLSISETVVSIHGYTKALSTSFIKSCNSYKVKTILTAHDYFSICPNGGLFNYKKNKKCDYAFCKKCALINCDSRNFLYKIYRNYRFKVQDKKNRFRERINYLITISDTNEKLLKPYFKKSKIIRIYNPTSINDKEDRVNCESNDYYIYVGRVDKEKGIDYLCESFLKSTKKLVIIGTGSELEILEKKYANDRILFLGWLNHDDVIKHMKKAVALVFPCLLYEGAPLTIFEAQSQGLPCIVSQYSNASDFINENNGYIYDPLDGSLNHILDTISNEDIKYRSINSYNNYWENPYDKKRYISEFINLLKGINDSK